MNSPEEIRESLCEVARIAYDQRLLDSAGGNLSVRLEDTVFCSPRYAGSICRWRLNPEDIVTTDLDGVKIAGDGEVSREIRMHVGIYRAFPDASAIIHAHPTNVMVFASLRRPIPPTSEQTEKYGVIELTDEHPARSAELARTVVDTLSRKREMLAEHAIACLLPYHGITVAGRDLDDAYDALERIDGSCRILIAGAAIRQYP